MIKIVFFSNPTHTATNQLRISDAGTVDLNSKLLKQFDTGTWVRYLFQLAIKYEVLCIRIRHYLYGSGSFHHQARKFEKPWFQVIVPSKSNKHKYLFFVGTLSTTDKTGRIRIWISSTDPRIRIRTVPKCHGSTTLKIGNGTLGTFVPPSLLFQTLSLNNF